MRFAGLHAVFEYGIVFCAKKIVMPDRLQFVPLTQNLVDAAKNFNQRLATAGLNSKFICLSNRDRDDAPPVPMEVERYIAVDANGEMRGGYLIRWQFLWLRGDQFLGATYGYPISEGYIDKKYTMLGVSILRDALKRTEYLYALGAGGEQGNLFSVAKHAGWKMHDVPFLFRIVQGGSFVRKLPQLQRSAGRRALAGTAAATGVASLATGLLHAASAASHGGNSALRLSRGITVERVETLADVADELWLRVRSQYDFCVVRDSLHVDPAFPRERTDLHRLVIHYSGSVIGWAVVMTEGLSRIRAFLGDVTPGLLVDAFGETQYADIIVRAATSYLASLGIEVIITNASHSRWLAAYKKAGYLNWRSQFPLIISKALAARTGDLSAIMARTHMSRGDADGVHYLVDRTADERLRLGLL